MTDKQVEIIVAAITLMADQIDSLKSKISALVSAQQLMLEGFTAEMTTLRGCIANMALAEMEKIIKDSAVEKNETESKDSIA